MTSNPDTPKKPAANRVTKPATPKKSPGKSLATETNLRFLWMCVHHNKNKKPDHNAVANAMGLSPKTTYSRYQQLKAYFEGMETPDNGDVEMEGAGSKQRVKAVKKGVAKQAKKVGGDDEENTLLHTNLEVKKEVKTEEDTNVMVKLEEMEKNEKVQVNLEDSDEDMYEA